MIELKQPPFTDKENFTLWQRRMRNTLGQQGLSVVLAGKDMKLETMTSEEWDTVDELGSGSIENYIADEDELLNLQMEEGGDLLEHLNTFNKINDEKSSQVEGLVAKVGERDCSSKHEGKKGNMSRSKFKAKDGCFECGSKEH
ncbi:Hypothetical predicted protein [Prunus dulcis]|uniref:Uncharacterized protein n=1 Tax=Prunus dulcis TaxID=3755 RepID=A0A5E4F2Z0_PRUDU|nr:hypothetical protein L3X38_001310 [Prunus dulcis]VVA22176.1 Hypothetical predicted protein [Prunus dulcis]